MTTAGQDKKGQLLSSFALAFKQLVGAVREQVFEQIRDGSSAGHLCNAQPLSHCRECPGIKDDGERGCDDSQYSYQHALEQVFAIQFEKFTHVIIVLVVTRYTYQDVIDHVKHPVKLLVHGIVSALQALHPDVQLFHLRLHAHIDAKDGPDDRDAQAHHPHDYICVHPTLLTVKMTDGIAGRVGED
jgi:hypothetical protein